MFNKLEKYQINGNIVGSVSGFQVDNSDPENVVILETANIDGSNTIGGVWWIDRILSDRFTGEKQVLHAISDDTLEVGNNDLEDVYLLGKSVNSFKVKYGSNIEQMWHSGNLVYVSQLENDVNYAYNDGSNATGDLQETIAWRHVHWNEGILNNITVAFTNALKDAYDAKLDVEDLDGYIYDVQYNSSAHTITFYQQNEPNIVIDLAVEQLITGVELVGNDLVFTFEDSSTVTVPLNTLLVGVVKSVNGLTPNSQGEVVINIADIPGLSSALDGKANASGNNLTNIGTWQSNLNVLTTNTNQTGLTGNKSVDGTWTFNNQINTANHGNSSQWKQAFDWGNFRDFNLGTTNGGYSNSLDTPPERTSFLNITGSFFGIPNDTDRPSGIFVKGTISSRWSWMGVTDKGTIRMYATNSSNSNTFVEVIHTGNLNSNATSLGFIKSADLSGYATETWVDNQNFSTQTLTEGANIQITGNVISATDTNTTYTGSNGIQLTGTNFTPDYGTTAGTIAQGNDTRINNGQTAFDWGNFRDFNLGTTNGGYVNSLDTPPERTSFLNITGSFFGIPNDTDRPSGIFVKGTVSSRWSWTGVTDKGPIRIYATNSENVNNYVEIYHTGNLNPAQYVLQSSLNTQLANYVPINGVTTINNTKTFTSSPIVPNATLISHAVNLGQLNSALDGNYLPLAGGTMNNGSVINWNIGTSAVIQLGGNNRIRVTFPNTFISSSVSGTTDGIYLRPRGDINATGQVRINGNGQITTHSHGDSSQWHEAYLAIQNLPQAEQDILFSTDFNTADVVTLNNPTIFYFTSFVDQLVFQVGSIKKSDELVVHNTSGVDFEFKIPHIKQNGYTGDNNFVLGNNKSVSFVLAYISGNPYFAIKHVTDIV